MHKFCVLIVAAILLSSCATLLNGKTTKVNIYAPNNSKITYENVVQEVKDGKATIYPLRSKDSLRFTLSNDSISKNIAYSKRTSTTYFFNIFMPHTLGLGYIVDLTNPKRFTYKKNHYFQIDSINNTFREPLNEPIVFKQHDIFIYTTPLKAVDAFSQPMFTFGAEYFFTDQMSISAEYGTVFSERLGKGRNPNFRLVEDKGRAFRYELKYYNLLSIASNPRINEYIGLEARFLRYQFNEDIRFRRVNQDISYTINETLAVQKSVDIFNIKYGLNYPIGKRCYIDLYSGFGLRIIRLKNPGRNFNPNSDRLIREDNSFFDFRRDHVEGIDEAKLFNFSLGFKFGIKF